MGIYYKHKCGSHIPFLPSNGYSSKKYQYNNCTGAVESRTVVYPNCLKHSFGVNKAQCDSTNNVIQLNGYSDDKCQTESGSVTVSTTKTCKSGTYYSDCGQVVSGSNQNSINFVMLIMLMVTFFAIM